MEFNFRNEINIDSIKYSLVKVQRDFVSAIYKSEDVGHFLRIGKKEKVQKDLENHQRLFKTNFPVSRVLEVGEFEGMFFYKETSLGKKLFGEIFENEWVDSNSLQENSLRTLQDISKNFLSVQIKNLDTKQDWSSFWENVLLFEIVKEMPHVAEKVMRKVTMIEEKFRDIPFTFSHGDFCSFNVLPGGVVDFENSMHAPIFFDTYSLIFYDDWFPINSDLEISGLFNYSEDFRKKYYQELDEILLAANLPKGSDFLEDLFFLKGLWLTAGMQRWPKFQKWRYDFLEKLL